MSRLGVTRGSLIYTNPATSVSVLYGQTSNGAPIVLKEQLHLNFQSASSSIYEAMSQSRLIHAHICQIYECFLEDAAEAVVKTVIVEEMMSRDVSAEIQTRAGYGQYWSERELIEILEQLASALAYAQSMGISHRDIKPPNIFISPQSVFKLGDFGSSKMNLASMTQTIQGTPFYLSPELRRYFTAVLSGSQQTQSYDPFKSDVYSLGLTVLQMAKLQVSTAINVQVAVRDLEQCCFKDILLGMVEVDPGRRWSFEDIAKYARACLNPVVPQPNADSQECIVNCKRCNVRIAAFDGSVVAYHSQCLQESTSPPAVIPEKTYPKQEEAKIATIDPNCVKCGAKNIKDGYIYSCKHRICPRCRIDSCPKCSPTPS